MRNNPLKRIIPLGAAVASLCAANVALAYSATNYPLFDTTNDTSYWWQGWGATATIAFDPANGVDTNGALSVHADFSTANDFAYFYTTGGAWNLPAFAYLTNFTGVQLDVRWDPASTLPNGTNYGLLTGTTDGANWSGSDGCNFIVPTNWSAYTPGATNVQDANNRVYFYTIAGKPGWYHFWHIWAPTFSVAQIGGFEVENYEGNGSGDSSITGPAGYYLSHVELIGNTAPPPPPPVMSIYTAETGLNLTPVLAGNGGDRESLRTFGGPTQDALYDNGFSGVGQVTNAFTIKDFPGPAYSGYQFHVFFVPYGAGSETAPDWNEPNVAAFRVLNNADGTFTSDFSYKTNIAGGQAPMLFNPAGTLASINSTKGVGTWILTWSNDGSGNAHFTITTPDGTSTNFVMDSVSASDFQAPMYTYVGVDPNNAANVGQPVVLSHVLCSNITASAVIVDDDFSGEALDPNNWDLTTAGQSTVADAGGVVQVPADAPVWVDWTLPDINFNLLVSSNLVPANLWTNATLTNWVFNNNRRTLILDSQLGMTNINSFFRLVNTNH
jgi:hypothetical protein